MPTSGHSRIDGNDEFDQIFTDYLEQCEILGVSARPRLRLNFIEKHQLFTADLRQAFAAEDLVSETDYEAATLPNFDGFEQIQLLALGGMGVVYQAYEVELSRWVALKMCRRDAGHAQCRRFESEASFAAQVEHSGSIEVYRRGRWRGRAYYTMRLLRGGSLAQRVHEFVGQPRKCAQLVRDVARQLRSIHQLGFIHRDLKPENILFDDQDQVHIHDFGLARHDRDATELQTITVAQKGHSDTAGTPDYMAPEQWTGAAISTAVDIWALGLVFIFVYTGVQPNAAEHKIHPQMLDALADKAVDPDLIAICQGCLEYLPENRWASADRVARLFDLWLRGLPSAHKWSLFRRHRVWLGRRPRLAAMAGVVLALCVLGDAQLVRTHLHDELTAEQETNTAVAQTVSYALAYELHQLRFALRLAGRNADLRAAIESFDQANMRKALVGIHQRFNSESFGFAWPGRTPRFQTWFLLDAHGQYLAHSTDQPSAENFAWRDYARPLHVAAGRANTPPYVSRVYRAKVGAPLDKFAVSFPITIGKELRALLVASVQTSSTLGRRMPARARQQIIVVAPKDRDNTSGDLRDDHVIIQHPAYSPGDEAVAIDHPILSTMQAKLTANQVQAPALYDSEYRDPVAGSTWVASFSKVPNSPFLVIVQSLREQAVAASGAWSDFAWRWLGLLMIVTSVYMGSLCWHLLRGPKRSASSG